MTDTPQAEAIPLCPGAHAILAAWGDPLAAAGARALDGLKTVLAAAEEQDMNNHPFADGRKAPFSARNGESDVARRVVNIRLKEDMRRLDALLYLVSVAAPRGPGPQGVFSPTRRGELSLGDSQNPDKLARSPHLWSLLAGHVKGALADCLTHLQLDIACLHCLLLPAGPAGNNANAGELDGPEESFLSNTELELAGFVGGFFGMHVTQYLDMCREAFKAVRSVVQYRTQGGLLGQGVQMDQSNNRSSRRGVSAGRIISESELCEENRAYALALSRIEGTSYFQRLRGVLNRNESLDSTHVNIINGPLADVVVSFMQLYNNFVARFARFQELTRNQQRNNLARNALQRLYQEHLNGSLSASCRELAVQVGECVKACDASVADAHAVQVWAEECVDTASGIRSEVAFWRLRMQLQNSLPHTLCLLGTLLSTLEGTCWNMAKMMTGMEYVANTTESHSKLLLPFAHAVAESTSELQSVAQTVGDLVPRLLHCGPHLPAGELVVLSPSLMACRLPTDDVAPLSMDAKQALTECARGWLRNPQDTTSPAHDPSSADDAALHDPLQNINLLDAKWVEARAALLRTLATDAKHATVDLPSSLANLMRRLTSVGDYELGPVTMAQAVMHELEKMDIILSNGAKDIMGLTAIPGDDQVTTQTVSYLLEKATRRMQEPTNALEGSIYSGGQTPNSLMQRSNSPPQRALRTEQAFAVSVLTQLFDEFAMVEAQLEALQGQVIEVDDPRYTMLVRSFDAMVVMVESLGSSLYLSKDMMSKTGRGELLGSAARGGYSQNLF